MKNATKRVNFLLWAGVVTALLLTIVYFGRGRYF